MGQNNIFTKDFFFFLFFLKCTPVSKKVIIFNFGGKANFEKINPILVPSMKNYDFFIFFSQCISLNMVILEVQISTYIKKLLDGIYFSAFFFSSKLKFITFLKSITNLRKKIRRKSVVYPNIFCCPPMIIIKAHTFLLLIKIKFRSGL